MHTSSLSLRLRNFLPDWGTYRKEWFGSIRADVLAATAVALALIPEAIAFSLIAGVDPRVGLYASFIIAVMASIFGGRPGMISGATGAMALLMIPLVANHGVEYLFAATILTGILQVAFRILRLSRYMKFVPKPVMVGFVNALALLIFLAQIPQMQGGGMVMAALVLGGLAIIYGFPFITKAIPSPLVAVVALTAIALLLGVQTFTVGGMGALPTTLPFFHLPSVPLNLETLLIIAPVAFGLALVGIIESLLTAKLVDEMTDTSSCKHTEANGQGIANIVTGFFGGMAGCAMIGQSVINVKSGGRGRLSTALAGIILLFLVLVLGDWVALIPTGALIAVMISVAIGTFDWRTFPRMKKLPITETLVMLTTVSIVLATHNLAIGVLLGVALSAVFFARSVGKLLSVRATRSLDGRRVYQIRGALFFATVEDLIAAIDLREDEPVVQLDLTGAHIWDESAVSAIDQIILKLRARGVEVGLTGMNQASARLVEFLGTHDDPGAAPPSGH